MSKDTSNPEAVKSLRESGERLDQFILAEAHWEFLERWLHMVFVDAFVHGYKHGSESRRQRRSKVAKQENKKETV